MNKVILQGSVGADPELRYGANGSAVLNIRLATNDRYKNKEGEWQDSTAWHRVVVFGKQAEFLSKTVVKGAPIMLEGKLNYGSYEKDGVKHYTTDVVAHDVRVFGKRAKSEGGETSQPSGGDDEIPF
jgi:single-strand DNA-binding protein